MPFLSPFLLAGLGLVALPWFIHRIRRPDPESVRFGSLMFVPEARREVIERRRVQHVLLMLLRMAVLAFLALAFARPFLERAEVPVEGRPSAGDHVILFDVSASMAGDIRFEAARETARRTVAEFPPGSRVGVVRFARSAAVMAPLEDPEKPGAGTLRAAQDAVRSLSPTWESTDFVVGLQTAERLFDPTPGQERLRVIHLVSDMQAAGLVKSESGWRLSADVRLDILPVVPPADNAAVEDVVLRRLEDRTEVRTRIRNYAPETRTLNVRLRLVDSPAADLRLVVPPGNATQALFRLEPSDGRSAIAGRVEIDADGLAVDNRRYLTWNPERVRTVGVLPAAWPDGRLLSAALPADAGLPWRLRHLTPADVAALRPESPDVLVSPHLDALSDAQRNAVDAYVRRGGRLLLLLAPEATREPLNALLDSTVRFEGPRRPVADDATFDRITWVDLGHPVFHPFRAPSYSDFSDLRFRNHHVLTPRDPETRVLARFETVDPTRDGDPALVELPHGRGTVLIWAAGIAPAWSTLVRDPRFVPLLHETIAHLAGEGPAAASFTVGDPITAPMEALGVPGPWLLEFATGTTATRIAVGTGERRPLERPGLYTWRSETDPGGPRTDAVNLDPRESDPTPLTESELRIRLAGAPPVAPAASPLPEQVGPDGRLRGEVGRGVLLLVLAALAAETLLARRCRQRRETLQ